jgi:hypothetical protein
MLVGVMRAGVRMMSARLSINKVKNVARTVLATARNKAGDKAIGEVGAAIHGLAQFL